MAGKRIYITPEDFVKRANLIHNNEFLYLDDYISDAHKITIQHKKCGYIFKIIPSHHIGYPNRKCKKCTDKAHTHTHEKFLKKVKLIHGDEYLYIDQYVNDCTKMQIKHKKCGYIFNQKPTKHLQGNGCPECRYKKSALKLTKGYEKFVKEAEIIHNNEYEYMGLYKNIHTKLGIKHKKCKYVFTQIPRDHLRGSGCPLCFTSKISNGERFIAEWLTKFNIEFLVQHKFNECINPTTNRKLKFDFYLPKRNILIEFDGPHHRKPVRFHKMTQDQAEQSFHKFKYRDEIKNIFCRNQKITLIRIPHTYSSKRNKANINIILTKILINH